MFWKKFINPFALRVNMAHRITLVRIRRPTYLDINQELQWLGNSLGLFGIRDRDSSCFRVFITLVKRSKSNQITSSDEIAERLGLTRGTVVHHLTRLMDSGIVIREKGGYILREADLQRLVKDLTRDVENMLTELQDVAKEIDQKMG